MDIADNADNRSREILPVIEPFADEDLRSDSIAAGPERASHRSIHYRYLRRVTPVPIVKPSPLYQRHSEQIAKGGGHDEPMTGPVGRSAQRTAAHNDRGHRERTIQRHSVGEGGALNTWNRLQRLDGVVGGIG